MRKMQLQICTAVFLLFTLLKLISPASAVLIKDELSPLLDRNDNYHRLAYRIERWLHPVDFRDAQPFEPHSPLDELRGTLSILDRDPMENLPKFERRKEQEAVSETNPVLEFGYAAREAFLTAQSQITDAAPPENVSYDVISLPFEESNPIVGETSSGFGYRIHPIDQELRFHYGTDYAADAGTKIHAFADGTVLEAGVSDGYGNYVKLDHGNGFVTLYGHCSALLVSEGEQIARGQSIALVGSTGQSTGPHLHFELMHDGIYLNPEFYLYA